MFLSRIELNPEAPSARSFWARVRSGYDVHRLVWSWFSDGPDRRRDFLYRVEGDGAGTRIYALSDRPPQDPEGLWTVRSKPFAPKLAKGEALRFCLRANPVRRAAWGEGAGRRHDVVMDARRRRGSNLPEAELVRQACVEWLLERGERAGFAIADEPDSSGEWLDKAVRADGYRQERFRKKGGAEVRMSTVEFEGLLTVEDPEKLVAALRQGIGPGKGFGCGLMMIRRG